MQRETAVPLTPKKPGPSRPSWRYVAAVIVAGVSTVFGLPDPVVTGLNPLAIWLSQTI